MDENKRDWRILTADDMCTGEPNETAKKAAKALMEIIEREKKERDEKPNGSG